MPFAGWRKPANRLSTTRTSVRRREKRAEDNDTFKAMRTRIVCKYYNRHCRWKRKNPFATESEQQSQAILTHAERDKEIKELEDSWAAATGTVPQQESQPGRSANGRFATGNKIHQVKRPQRFCTEIVKEEPCERNLNDEVGINEVDKEGPDAEYYGGGNEDPEYYDDELPPKPFDPQDFVLTYEDPEDLARATAVQEGQTEGANRKPSDMSFHTIDPKVLSRPLQPDSNAEGVRSLMQGITITYENPEEFARAVAQKKMEAQNEIPNTSTDTLPSTRLTSPSLPSLPGGDMEEMSGLMPDIMITYENNEDYMAATVGMAQGSCAELGPAQFSDDGGALSGDLEALHASPLALAHASTSPGVPELRTPQGMGFGAHSANGTSFDQFAPVAGDYTTARPPRPPPSHPHSLGTSHPIPSTPLDHENWTLRGGDIGSLSKITTMQPGNSGRPMVFNNSVAPSWGVQDVDNALAKSFLHTANSDQAFFKGEGLVDETSWGVQDAASNMPLGNGLLHAPSPGSVINDRHAVDPPNWLDPGFPRATSDELGTQATPSPDVSMPDEDAVPRIVPTWSMAGVDESSMSGDAVPEISGGYPHDDSPNMQLVDGDGNVAFLQGIRPDGSVISGVWISRSPSLEAGR